MPECLGRSTVMESFGFLIIGIAGVYIIFHNIVN